MFVVILALLGLLASQAHCAPAAHTCQFHGKTYNVGDSFEDPFSCNTCFCDHMGVGCTEIYCPRDPVGREVINPRPGFCRYGDQDYKVGDVFKLDCNSCMCSPDGLVACTAMACSLPENSPVGREVINPTPGFCNYGGDHIYKAFESWKSYCNTCMCSPDGWISCTIKACNLPTRPPAVREVINPRPGFCDYGGHTYKAGEGFKSTDGCNSCGCQESGMVICTMLACLRIPVLEGNIVSNRREVLRRCFYNGEWFTHGQSTKAIDGCNVCTCQADDNRLMPAYMACTEMACIPGHGS